MRIVLRNADIGEVLNYEAGPYSPVIVDTTNVDPAEEAVTLNYSVTPADVAVGVKRFADGPYNPVIIGFDGIQAPNLVDRSFGTIQSNGYYFYSPESLQLQGVDGFSSVSFAVNVAASVSKIELTHIRYLDATTSPISYVFVLVE